MVGRVILRTTTVIEKIWSVERERYYEVIAPGTEGQKPSFPNTAHVHSASNSVPPALFPEKGQVANSCVPKATRREKKIQKSSIPFSKEVYCHSCSVKKTRRIFAE